MAKTFIVEAATALVPGGKLIEIAVSSFGEAASNRVFDWFGPRKASERQLVLDALAVLSPEEVREILNQSSVLANLSYPDAETVIGYCEHIPNSTRRAISRPGESGPPRTTPSQLPRTVADMARFLPPRPPRLRRGMVVAGDLVLEQLLGQGGFGEVWRASSQHLSETYALKFCLDAELSTFLNREVEILAKMREADGHKNIVKIEHTNLGQEPPFLQLEYIEGGDLMQWAARFDGNPIPSDYVVEVLDQIAQGLSFAHDLGIVHRDLKPANVLLTLEGTCKIADLGIASLARPSGRHTALTQLSAGAGTTIYADPRRSLDVPSPSDDIYALGIMGIQMLLGDLNRPPPDDWAEDLAEAGIREDLITLLKRSVGGLKRRPPDAGSFHSSLREFRNGTGPVEAYRNDSLPEITRAEARIRSRAGILASSRVVQTVAVGGLVLGLAAFLIGSDNEPPGHESTAPDTSLTYGSTFVKALGEPSSPSDRMENESASPDTSLMEGSTVAETVEVPTVAETTDEPSSPSDRITESEGTFAGWEDFEVFSECPKCPEMIALPGGSFIMGSPDTEEGRYRSEGPQRWVRIAPFALAKAEVTFNQWQACVDGSGCQSNPNPSDEGWGRETRPVMNVSWNDAQEYIAWLNTQIEGSDPYRLPTEAEWEFAARADTTTPFAFGETISTDQANYFGHVTYGSGKKGVYRQRTVPVGDLEAANAWGLRHMHGNVLEWVEDCWHGTYAGAPTDGSAWLSEQDGDCSLRVLRGGAWNNRPDVLRPADRGRGAPDTRNWNLGFRPARMLLTP